MSSALSISLGQYSHQGQKESNQDFHGACVPQDSTLQTKGIAIAIADGVSSSAVSDLASQTAVRSFLEDYYCTADSWSVKGAVKRVLLASNSWLFAQNQRNHEYRLNRDRGYVCTFSALVLKSSTAHLFHVGDAQIARVHGQQLEVLTEAHRAWVSAEKSYLSRALGMSQHVDIDYRTVSLSVGDVFVVCTDGVYEHLASNQLCALIDQHANDLDVAARHIVDAAMAAGSQDNLTVQLVKIEHLPDKQASEVLQQLNTLPFPPALQARMQFDGYEIIRSLHSSHRSNIVLAKELGSERKVALKLPSTEGREDDEYLERFLMEEWVAKRIDNAHVIKPLHSPRPRQYLYTAFEYIEGQTLAQWMIDNPSPDLDQVRAIVTQIARGLQAFHRQEMLHQDLRPHNVMIDTVGTVKIIDLGSTFVAGLEEIQPSNAPQWALGTAQFLAPEYFLGEYGSTQSDLYSLACITYHLLSGRSPYGAAVAKARSRAEQRRLVYQSVLDQKRRLPAWLDLTLKKALHPEPIKRYTELSEFVYDLGQPNPKFVNQTRPPLLERNPVRVWQGISATLLAIIVVLLLR